MPPWGPTYSKSDWCSSTLVSSYCSNKGKGSARERGGGWGVIESEESERRGRQRKRTVDKNGGEFYRDVGTQTKERQKKKRERGE